MAYNRIGVLKADSFLSQRWLERIILRGNRLTTIEGGAFNALAKIHILNLSYNRLNKLNSDTFQGAEKMEYLDMSNNYFDLFPSIALKSLTALKHLNLSSNMISKIEISDISSMTKLEVLDLSRNNIAHLHPGLFTSLKSLRYLDLGVNQLRTIEENALNGLQSLEMLNLQDNNLLSIPATALMSLPRLAALKLDYNRITAIPPELLKLIASRLTIFGLAKNVIRELPPDVFRDFQKLKSLDLNGNFLINLEPTGLEESLDNLNVRDNQLTTVSASALNYRMLTKLDLSRNNLKELDSTAFSNVPTLLQLNVSRNSHLASLPPGVFDPLRKLEILDLSSTGLKQIPPFTFDELFALMYLNLAQNHLTEIPEMMFKNLLNLTYLDLSNNNIVNIRVGSLYGLSSMKRLDLSFNKLTTFKGDYFNSKIKPDSSSLEELNLNNNELSYLFPSSFTIHSKLKTLKLAFNKFNYFPKELILGLNNIQEVDLSNNQLKTIDDYDYGFLPRLRKLNLNNNNIDSISETCFFNSSQLQIINLSFNRLEKLGERLFNSLYRLKILNLNNNSLSELPDTIFERSRIRMLEHISLAWNQFTEAPLRSLQKQYFFLTSVDLSHNNIEHIPSDDSTMVNIKHLDLSFNPLTRESVNNILNEPKTVRALNLAGTNIEEVVHLETPFLQYLNLSYNNIKLLGQNIFDRSTLLEELDLGHNAINSLDPFTPLWAKLHNLQTLDLSYNPIDKIKQGHFDSLNSLIYLSLTNLPDIERIEKFAFKNFYNLEILKAYNYPKLGYMDTQGLLNQLTLLEILDIEITDTAIGSDQVISIMNARLKQLVLRGSRLKSVLASTLAGLKSPEITIGLHNSSVTSLPPALLVPLPRSSRITLDIGDNAISTLSAQFLVQLEDRKNNVVLTGLERNPIQCDCNARALRRSHLGLNIVCTSPVELSSRLLVETGDDELTCDVRKTTTTSTTAPTTVRSTRRSTTTTSEPEIIWSLPPNTASPVTKRAPIVRSGASMTTISNDDTLIIGIVGGVIGFIVILIIIICIVRLRMINNNSIVQAHQHCMNPQCPCPKYMGSPYMTPVAPSSYYMPYEKEMTLR
uniref:Insulin-like growth factor-binding protein complex acid labile subunit n=1 Tax=Cacopsylla melanoneura TaxID=428564 RepID=A0A8D8Z9Q1_9HEMI